MYNEPLDCTVSFVSIYTVDWWGMESAKPSRKSPSGRSVRCGDSFKEQFYRKI